MMSSTIEAAPPAAFSPRKISLPSLTGLGTGLGRVMLAGIVALSFALAGCENQGGGSPGIGTRTAIGGLGGAAAGGLIAAAAGGGSMAIAAGVIGGGLLGGAVGNYLDQRDRQIANQTAQRAFETAPAGQATTWQNPDSGHSGSITPTRTFQQANGAYCREFQQSVVVAGKTQQAFGTACRQPDGQWRIVS